MQEILILLIFLAAIIYLVRMFWKQANGEAPGCAKGCGGCSTLNPDQIVKQIQAKQANS